MNYKSQLSENFFTEKERVPWSYHRGIKNNISRSSFHSVFLALSQWKEKADWGTESTKEQTRLLFIRKKKKKKVLPELPIVISDGYKMLSYCSLNLIFFDN